MHYKVINFNDLELNIGFEHHEDINDIEALEVLHKGGNIIELLSNNMIALIEYEVKSNENN